jgi:hypothetical protein
VTWRLSVSSEDDLHKTAQNVQLNDNIPHFSNSKVHLTE